MVVQINKKINIMVRIYSTFAFFDENVKNSVNIHLLFLAILKDCLSSILINGMCILFNVVVFLKISVVPPSFGIS
jgi:hypothetical protein